MPPVPKHPLKVVDDTVPGITFDYSKCIGCNACVRQCANQSVYTFKQSELVGYPPFINCYSDPDESRNDIKLKHPDSKETPQRAVKLANSFCVNCGQCASVCPTGALHSNHADIDSVLQAIEKKISGQDPDLVLSALIAPSTRAAVSEAACMGAKDDSACGESTLGQLSYLLREIGVNYIFDVNSGADLTTIEDANEALEHCADRATVTGSYEHVQTSSGRWLDYPVFTSCCPAWVRYVESFYPEFIPNISTAKSCVAMNAAVAREKILHDKYGHKNFFIFTVMPCTAKKLESRREQLVTDSKPTLDAVITVNELPALLDAVVGLYKKYLPEKVDKLVEVIETRFTPAREQEMKSNPETTELAKCDNPFAVITGTAEMFGVATGVGLAVIREIAYRFGADPRNVDFAMQQIWDDSKDVPAANITQTILVATVKIVPNIKLMRERKTDNEIAASILKEIEEENKKFEFKLIIAHGGKAIHKVMEDIRARADYTIGVLAVEMMFCPGGCRNGGGMPKYLVLNKKKGYVETRGNCMKTLYANNKLTAASENVDLIESRDNLLPDCNARHHALHTTFKHNIPPPVATE